MSDFSHNGAIKVNGQWATAIRYEAEINAEGIGDIDVRFMNSRTPVARVTLTRIQALEALGEANVKTIEAGRTLHSVGASDADTLKGELRGKTLHYRDITVPLSVLGAAPNELHAGSAKHSGGAAGQESGTAPKSQAHGLLHLPPHVTDRYLIVKKRFHFPDQSVAFVDKGDRLQAKSENSQVIRDLLAIAEARGWATITATGTQSFRRAVWREATRLGMSITGYRPNEVERLAAERARSGPPENSASQPARDESRTPNEKPRSSLDPRHAVVYGTFIAAGRDHYKHDPTENVSFYLKVQTSAAEKTYWGVGLEDALIESRTVVRVGDEIGIQQLRRVPVNVPVSVKDEHGQVIGQETKALHRNEWAVEKRAYFSDPARVEQDLSVRLVEREAAKHAHATPPPKMPEKIPDSPASVAPNVAVATDEQATEAARSRKATSFQHTLRLGPAAKEQWARENPDLIQALAWIRVAQITSERLHTPEQRDEFVRLVEEAITNRIASGQKIKIIAIKELTPTLRIQNNGELLHQPSSELELRHSGDERSPPSMGL